MKQGSNEWHEWRRMGIGSSDAPVIMGVSPYKTRFQLWEEKTGKVPSKETSNYIQQKGHDNEPRARALFEIECDIEMPADLAVHPKYPFLRASLDGINREAGCVLELKYVGKEDHVLAKNEKKVPEKYEWQCVHQHLVTELPLVKYGSFYRPDGSKGELIVVDVPRDVEKEKVLFEEAKKFWELVQSDTPPELTDRDFKRLRRREDVEFFEQFKKQKLLVEEQQEILEKLKEQLVLKYGSIRIRCGGVQMMPICRKGAVEYAKIPQLKGLDLEKFRKKPTVYVDIRLMKEQE
jgi:putative phage-type endonuclease